MSPELRSRLLVASVGVPVALFAMYQGGWVLAALIAAIAAVTAHEFYALAQGLAGHPVRWLGIPASAVLVLLAGLEPTYQAWAPGALAALLLLGLLTFAASILGRNGDRAPLAVATTVSGAMYTGGTLSFAVLLRNLPEGAMPPPDPLDGALLLLYPIAVTWLGDTAAYFGGRKFGRRRLAPAVSPGKTVEGGVCGVLGSLAAGLAMAGFLDNFRTFPVALPGAVLISVCLAVAGQLGDLAESGLKRRAGVKDSGSILPGHGGMLDRFDALFFTIPLAYGLILVHQGLR